MNSFQKILSAVVAPLVGLVEGLISITLIVFFGILKGINQFVTLLKRYGKPFGEKLFSVVGQIIHGVVSLAFGFHAYMNQPPKHFPAVIRPILSGLNLILTPVYAVMRVSYRFMVRTFEIVRDDLAHLLAWISEQWQGLLTKAGIATSLSGEQSLTVGERITPKTIQEKYQTYLRGQSQELGREFQEFRQELSGVIAQARNSLGGKSKQDAIDQLSPFAQERNTIIISSVLINILALAFPLLMLQLYDRILSQRSIDTLVVFCVGVALAVALESIIRIFRSYATAWISARFEHQAYVALTDRLLAEPINEFERKGTGTVLEEFKAISTLRYHYSGQTFQQLLDLPFTLLYVLIVFFISPWIGLLLLVGYSIFAFITWRNGRSFPAIVKDQKDMDLRRGNLLTEILKNVHTMKSMTMEALMLRRYERLQESCAKLMSKVTYALDMSSGVGSVFSPLMTVLVIALGAFLVITNQLSNGELAACILLGLRALAPLQRLGGMWSKHQQDQVLRDKLNELFKLPTLPAQQLQDDKESLANDEVLASSLSLVNITYQFPAVSTPIFENVSLDIAAGECIAIGGQSGSGRSTLLELMAGIVQPKQGRVLIDGIDIQTLDLDKLASMVAYLPQRTVMFEGSLLDNITAFDPTRMDRAIQIAKDLGLTDFVSRLPRGWDSVVGDMAADSMPPGFRQRVAIARALSSNPRVILFDDSSASMDSEGDAMLLQYMTKMCNKATIVLVSSRPSFLRLAHRTLYLHDGKLYNNPMQAVTPLSTAIPKAEGGLSAPALLATFTPMAPAQFFENRELARVGDEKWHHVGETVNTNFKELSDFSECLTLLLKVINSPYSARDVAESLPYYIPSLDLTGIQNAMATLGYQVTEVPCQIRDIDVRAFPCLFVPSNGPAFVILGRVGQQLRVGISATEEPRLLNDLSMSGVAYFFQLREAPPNPEKSWVWGALYRFAGLIGQGSISSLVAGVILMASSLFLMAAYSLIIPTGAKENLLYLTIGAIAAVILSYFFIKQRASILALISGRIEYLFGTAVLQHVLTLPPSFSERASVGSQIARLQIFQGIRDAFTGPLASTGLELPATLVLLIGLSIINPIALLLFVIMLTVYAILFMVFYRRTNDQVNELSRVSSKRTEFLIEMINKMRFVRECGAQYIWLERLREVSASASMSSFQAERLSSMLVGISYFVMMLSALGIVAFTTPAVFNQTVSSGALIASMLLMWRVLTPLQTLFVNMTRIERIRLAVRQIDSLMKIQSERPNEIGSSPLSRGLEGRLEFARVSFRYSMNVDPAILGVEFKVQKGELVAITGANGSGKTTLLKLLMGLYTPQAGSILIDGVDIRQIDPLELRRIIGYAPQDTQFFRATIAQNLRLARPDATDEDIYQVLDMAGALSGVLALPNGINYRLGDNTNELPSTLKQKLLLARTYITRAPIMVFDEPGSGLDAEGDAKFIETLKALKGNTTVLFISHRPSHIRIADTLLVFDKGYLRAAGPPNDLLKQPVSA